MTIIENKRLRRFCMRMRCTSVHIKPHYFMIYDGKFNPDVYGCMYISKFASAKCQSVKS